MAQMTISVVFDYAVAVAFLAVFIVVAYDVLRPTSGKEWQRKEKQKALLCQKRTCGAPLFTAGLYLGQENGNPRPTQ